MSGIWRFGPPLPPVEIPEAARSTPDWKQAQPLQCGYPATAPAVGDYLTVEDNLPPLESGQGRYYVTAVTHQGQTRYGRKSSGGVLSGRDPAVLPSCAE